MDDNGLQRWHERIGRATRLLAERLDDPPTLEELAGAAFVSPFHFHRVWRGLTGETVNQSVARMRIEASKSMLNAPGATVTGVALGMGFGTPQSFARAFKAQEGVTPSSYARGRERVDNAPPQVDHQVEPAVRIALTEDVKVVAFKRVGGAYVSLNALFQRVWDWAAAEGCSADLKGLYGVPYDDPESVDEDALRYAACMDLGIARAPAPFEIVNLTGGLHAVVRNLGPYDGLEAKTQRLVGGWLPRSGHEPADRPIFHHFHNDPETTDEADLITDIYLPLQS